MCRSPAPSGTDSYMHFSAPRVDLQSDLILNQKENFMYILVGRGLGEAPSCASTNCSAISVDRFDKQPADLQRVLAKSFKDPAGWFEKLDPKAVSR